MPSNSTGTPQPIPSSKAAADGRAPERRVEESPYLRAANEDDDGYDPYSDRPAAAEPLFERDPWS